jgi:hypothetical protein
MKKLPLAVLLASVLLAACAYSALDDAIRKSLKDPDSAKFGQHIVEKTHACVVVNAKNGYGGYTGDKTAWLSRASEDSTTWSVDSMDDTPCYQALVHQKVVAYEASVVYRHKVVKLLQSKGVEIADDDYPYFDEKDPKADRCIELAGDAASFYRLAQDKVGTADYEDWSKKAEVAFATLQSKTCPDLLRQSK